MMSGAKAYFIVDINGSHEAHQRCVDFVTECSIKYGLSSKNLSELGGSEKARLAELYENDYAWSSKGRMQVAPPLHDRIVFSLFEDAAPNCCKNFMLLCSGEKGKSKGGGGLLHYKNTPLHRLVKGQFIQGGDFSHGTGAGGESIWGGVFKDDKAALNIKLESRGLLAMSNTGKNTNGSQFFITLGPLPKLSGKHCVFGKVVEGIELLDQIEMVGVEREAPMERITIIDCGLC